jgi:hypothetical protein
MAPSLAPREDGETPARHEDATGAEAVGDLHLPETEAEAVKGGATPSDLSTTKTIDKSSPQRYTDVPPA